MSMHGVPATGWHERCATVADHHRPDPFTPTTTRQDTAMTITAPTAAVSLVKRPRVNYVHPARVTADPVRTAPYAVSYVHPDRTAPAPSAPRPARGPRTVSLARAQRLALAHSTSLARLFVDYPPLRRVVDGDADDDAARVPLSAVVTALGY